MTAEKNDHTTFNIATQQINKWFNSIEGYEMKQVNTTLISKYLATKHNLPMPKSIEIDNQTKEIILEYKVPAGYASAILNLELATLIIEKQKGALLTKMNDLHKGRNSGLVWSWLIDISSIFIIIFSLTGLIILYQGKKYKQTGSLSIAFGLFLPFIIYLLFVPTI